ncbi:hypothetical protein [Corynebacterium pygosceleis]|uniref:Or membrane protein n=1 Tax=Corynebacterium pygosceleis TaxID=2800406 RepID=A0A9Q4C8F6_9CORY|nr:hypothetical protein [Corynebacterium pygosceleis]MCK7637240.1 hypothetical protein [Corynebacterium pygosceleis]MCK7676177.1 hypothetical protein [Corynebacterium pygosceleis]MCL0119985.1 hypothetical protein [Corynebacterium pygosceleis]MCX7445143.1 hypothetical protein [Corynebacterium pygosceleis]MCX7468432.1 hypothetical protein [Corynebacterium pygosceleis]
MRNIRKAAIAATAAVALTLGATTAVAEESDSTTVVTNPAATDTENPTPNDGPNEEDIDPNFDPANPDGTKNTDSFLNDLSSQAGGSSEWGDRFDGDDVVTGNDLLGSTKNWENQPMWSKIWYGVTVAGVLASVLGLFVFPVLNQHLNNNNT